MRISEIAAKPQTLYVCRPVVNADDIHAWAEEQGFKSAVPEDDLHVTIAFSKDKVIWNDIPDTTDEIEIKGGKREVKPLGDKGAAVVLKFESKELHERWQEFRDHGCSWDFPSYQCHVTITYDGKDMDLSGVTPYDGPIILGPEKFNELDTGWSDKLEEVALDEDMFSKRDTNFLRWFAGSKVVNQRGEPLKVYHGTDAHFSAFAPDSHFGTRRAANDRIRNRFGKDRVGQHIIPVYLRITNPLRVTDAEASNESMLLNAIVRGKYPDLDPVVARKEGAYEAARRAGYDGLVYNNRFEDRGKNSWVIFHPSQAKSALGNKEFDPEKPGLMEGMRLDDFDDLDRLYAIFADSYKKETGVAWSKDKFLSRARGWVFYGDETGYVAVRPQRSGMKKLVAVAGDARGILKGLDELSAEGGPIWGAVSAPLAKMAKKRGMIVPHLVMGGPTVLKALVRTIPPEVFGGVTPTVEPDGGVALDYADTGRAVKYLIGNREYFAHALGLPQVKEALAKIPGVGMVLKLMGIG